LLALGLALLTPVLQTRAPTLELLILALPALTLLLALLTLGLPLVQVELATLALALSLRLNLVLDSMDARKPVSSLLTKVRMVSLRWRLLY